MTDAPSHPAKFSDEILAEIGRTLVRLDVAPRAWIVDPFAGVGRVHELAWPTFGIEIEPEWAATNKRTWCGDSTKPETWGTIFGGVIGALFLALVFNIMGIAGVLGTWQMIVNGLILILAVYTDVIVAEGTLGKLFKRKSNKGT